MQKIYEKLLTTERARESTNAGRNIVIESESDRARLVFSAPFRRLQQKAQVFSLEENAAVRSRLTHSIEVAQIGRFIANQIVNKLFSDNGVDPKSAQAFVNFVEVACLMHDLGNPPFGHFGEAAIANWFSENGAACVRKALGLCDASNIEIESLISDGLADFKEFDGNCQGLRIATLLQWNTDEFGLNLTFTTLASYLKYIRAPLFDSVKVRDLPFRKKAGFFSTEKTVVETMWKHFGYSIEDPKRFPLAYIMEAADDIAYCISDLEDSIEKELLHPNIVFKALHTYWEEATADSKISASDPGILKLSSIFAEAANSPNGNKTTFTTFRTRLSTYLTEVACQSYCDNHQSILDGECRGLIQEKTPEGIALYVLKEYCRKYVYHHVSVHQTELTGLTAINGLLEHFRTLLSCRHDRFLSALDNKKVDFSGSPIIIERKLLALFPEKHIIAYRHSLSALDLNSSLKNQITEWNLRGHLITDFISGMTDDFALRSYQMLSGMRKP